MIGIITETGLRPRLQNKVTETFSFQSPVFYVGVVWIVGVSLKISLATEIWTGTWTGRMNILYRENVLGDTFYSKANHPHLSGAHRNPSTKDYFQLECNVYSQPRSLAILGINVISAGSQSTELNCVEDNHLAASCSNR